MTSKDIQKRVFQNKVAHGFNVTDISKEFCLLYGEVGEAYEAWRKKSPTLGEELADVAIYLLGIAEICNFDLGAEIERKMEINESRQYKIVDGVHTDRRIDDGTQTI